MAHQELGMLLEDRVPFGDFVTPIFTRAVKSEDPTYTGIILREKYLRERGTRDLVAKVPSSQALGLLCRPYSR